MERIHIDLFSGIGGNSLALDQVFGDLVHVFCEIDPFCQVVLKKHWPHSKIHGDIKTFQHDGRPVFIVSGGFPCQPYSVAGKRKGKADDRDLWPDMFRVIRETRPRWIVGENNPGFVSMELDRSISDLESAGYTVQTFDIPALGVDARHIRHRIWIVAHANSDVGGLPILSESGGKAGQGAHALGSGENLANSDSRQRIRSNKKVRTGRHAAVAGSEDIPDTNSIDGERSDAQTEEKRTDQKRPARLRNRAGEGDYSRWPTEPRVGRVATGVPLRVDRVKALGNSIVPQVAERIFRAIKSIDDQI